jgi:hypothetical protein
MTGRLCRRGATPRCYTNQIRRHEKCPFLLGFSPSLNVWRRGRDCRSASRRSIKSGTYCTPAVAMCTSIVSRSRPISLHPHRFRSTHHDKIHQDSVGDGMPENFIFSAFPRRQPTRPSVQRYDRLSPLDTAVHRQPQRVTQAASLGSPPTTKSSSQI